MLFKVILAIVILDMKMLSKSQVKKFANTTSQLIDEWDDCIKTGYHSIAHYILYPQLLAGYNGLKKLVEKDYSVDNTEITGSLVSS